MTVPDILRAAAGEVRKGWTRFVRRNSDDEVCALGALDRVVGSTYVGEKVIAVESVEFANPAAVAALLRVIMPAAQPIPQDPRYYRIGDRVSFGGTLIADWNNAPERTAEDVAIAMEFAALVVDQDEALRSSVEGISPQARSSRGVEGVAVL